MDQLLSAKSPRDLFLHGTVIGTDRLLVLLEPCTEELVLELERFRQLAQSRRRDGGRRSDRGSGLRHHGVGVSVREKKETTQVEV